MTNQRSDKQVCFRCIGDPYLKDEVEKIGAATQCSYCRQSGPGLGLEELAEQIHGILEQSFYQTSTEPQDGVEWALYKEGDWERAGDPIADVIADIAGLDEDVVNDVREHLYDWYGNDPSDDIGEDPYDENAQYAEKPAYSAGLDESWASFCREITSRARFFSRQAANILDEIFGGITTLKTRKGQSVIKTVEPGAEDGFFFRARIAPTFRDLEVILKDPVRELGPPRSSIAKSGRMNPVGVSVFYGARDIHTCIAEIRAPVGAYVVSGQFEVMRPLRLLDFEALMDIATAGSYFDPEFKHSRDKAEFLKRLAEEMSRPVMPADELLQYLPTQAVAEWLSERFDPKLDGIIFHSSQTGGEGRNVVLLHHASRVEPYELPTGSSVEVREWNGPEDDPDDSISVFESVPKPEPEKPKDETIGLLATLAEINWDPPKHEWDDRTPTLRLRVPDIEVRMMKAVTYKSCQRYVSRHRSQKVDRGY
jgi:hypothetical protein